MELNRDNLEVYAAQRYTNSFCMSKSEFIEDLNKSALARKMARKFARRKTDNIRLFCNHVLCFTNNFEPRAAKHILLLDLTEHETAVMCTVLNYLGFTTKEEVQHIDMFTAQALKEMDK